MRSNSTAIKVIKFAIAMFLYPIAILADLINQALFGKTEEFFEERVISFPPISRFLILLVTISILSSLWIPPEHYRLGVSGFPMN